MKKRNTMKKKCYSYHIAIYYLPLANYWNVGYKARQNSFTFHLIPMCCFRNGHLQLHLLIVTFQEESEELACSSTIEKKGSYIFILSTNEICPRYICRPFYLKCKDFYKTFIMLTNVLLMSNHIFSNANLKKCIK